MASGPLDGVRVLEFTQIIAGPLSCQLLADLGADVIKVEPPGGEPWRLNAQFIPLESKTFMGLNRGKRSLAIDVAHPKSREAIHRLVRDVDVVVINYRPDVAERLQIDYESLRALKPDLVYVDNTAFGREGPWAQRPGYDIVVQAASGTMAAVGKVDAKGNPVVPPAFADLTTGFSMALATSAALYYRAMTGKGQKVETSLFANALHLHMSQFMSVPAADAAQRAAFDAALERARAEGTPYAQFLEERQEILRRGQGGNIYYRCFLTKDGAIAIGALSSSLRDKVRRALEVEHNRDEPGYDPEDPEQKRRDTELVEHVEALIRSKPSDYWEEHFERHGVPVSRVYFVQELLDHPQVTANGLTVRLDHELAGETIAQAPPWKMSESQPQTRAASPVLGRHTDEILRSAGYDDDEIAAMRAEGAIR